MSKGAKNRLKRVIGLMSGTSCDGITACLAEIKGSGIKSKVYLKAFKTYPYDKETRHAILELCKPETGRIDKLSRMNITLGKLLANAAKGIAKKAKIPMREIDLIGSHGQTVFHSPKPIKTGSKYLSSTLQIGEPSVIAQETGATVVADFRLRDIAAGGSGAPLVPYVDYLLFRDNKISRAIQNLGGIANVTFLPSGRGMKDIIAFDTGPGNMVIDRITQIITKGKLNYDEDGHLAAKGKPNKDLLARLLSHPYFSKPPPKSTGREDFGACFAENLYKEAKGLGIKGHDLLATVTALTARSIREAYRRFIEPNHRIDEVILCGGGTKNPTLFRFLEKAFSPAKVMKMDSLGIPAEAKEALSFAVLANETISGNPANVPQVTGAKKLVVLGKIVPGQKGTKFLL